MAILPFKNIVLILWISLCKTNFVPKYYVLFLNCLCCKSIKNGHYFHQNFAFMSRILTFRNYFLLYVKNICKKHFQRDRNKTFESRIAYIKMIVRQKCLSSRKIFSISNSALNLFGRGRKSENFLTQFPKAKFKEENSFFFIIHFRYR